MVALGGGGLFLSPVRPATPAPILHPTLYTLHPAPCSLPPTAYSLQPTAYSLQPTPHTLHPTPCNLHPTPQNLQPAPSGAAVHAHSLDVQVESCDKQFGVQSLRGATARRSCPAARPRLVRARPNNCMQHVREPLRFEEYGGSLLLLLLYYSRA